MKITKNLFLKIIIICIIIIIPIVILFVYSKEHTFIEQNNRLSSEYKQYFNSKYTILYIGYSGCRYVCTPRLKEISTIQRVLNDRGDKVEFKFLDLRVLGDDISRDFLKAFEGEFTVLSLDNSKKKKLLRELNFYYTRALYDSLEFEHTSYLYVIKKVAGEINLVATIMQYPFLNDKTIEFLHRKVNVE